jgi:hypothetical protein
MTESKLTIETYIREIDDAIRRGDILVQEGFNWRKDTHLLQT